MGTIQIGGKAPAVDLEGTATGHAEAVLAPVKTL